METAESVTGGVVSTDVPVAISPDQLNKPVSPDLNAAGNAEAELLKTKLGLANQHAKTAKKEAEDAKKQLQDLQQQLEDVKNAQQAAVRQSLEDQGQFRELYEQEKARAKTLEQRLLNDTAELRAQLESVTQQSQHERLKAAALGQISQANAVNPQQLYALLQPQLRVDDEGNPVALNGGVETPLGDYIANLKQAPEWQHHFSASGAGRGMGAAPTSVVAPGMTNPYRAETRNLTAALQLEVSNPELAKALKAEAARG
jgi:hypothetical protein